MPIDTVASRTHKVAQKTGIIAYHYCSDSNFQMNNPGNGDFLRPRSKILAGCLSENVPDWIKKQRYTYAFMGAEPEQWTESIEFPEVWKMVMRHVSASDMVVRRLSFPLIDTDEAYVLDWAHVERVRDIIRAANYLSGTCLSLDDARQTQLDASQQSYIQSRVPLAEYDGNHILPELIIANPIPLERIVVEVL
jgi:hypothetical protein